MVHSHLAPNRRKNQNPQRYQETFPRLATRLTTQILAALDAQTVTLPAETTWETVISALIGD